MTDEMTVITKQSFFENKLQVTLPDDFIPMPEDLIEQRYPETDRPQIILSDPGGIRFCTFSLLDSPLLPAEVKSAIGVISSLFSSLYPSCQLAVHQVIKLNNLPLGWFSFRTILEDENIYNMMFVLPVDQRLMLGTCGCRLDDKADKMAVRKIMESLEAEETKPRFGGRIR